MYSCYGSAFDIGQKLFVVCGMFSMLCLVDRLSTVRRILGAQSFVGVRGSCSVLLGGAATADDEADAADQAEAEDEEDEAERKAAQLKPKRDSTFRRKIKSAAAKVNTGLKKGMSAAKAIVALNDAVRYEICCCSPPLVSQCEQPFAIAIRI